MRDGGTVIDVILALIVASVYIGILQDMRDKDSFIVGSVITAFFFLFTLRAVLGFRRK